MTAPSYAVRQSDPERPFFLAAVTLTAFIWSLNQSPAKATPISLMTLALAQIFHLATVRGAGSNDDPVGALSNPYAIAAGVLAIGLAPVRW